MCIRDSDGPIDGHDINALVAALETAKAHNHSVLVHVNTVKGKGYNLSLIHI